MNTHKKYLQKYHFIIFSSLKDTIEHHRESIFTHSPLYFSKIIQNFQDKLQNTLKKYLKLHKLSSKN